MFLKAAAEGQTPRVKHLLHLGTDVDFVDVNGFKALHHAGLSRFENTVAVLLQAGADVNAQSPCYGTPLCIASLKVRENIVKLLLKHRADVNAAGLIGGTPLYCASFARGTAKLARPLLDHSARLESECLIDSNAVRSFILGSSSSSTAESLEPLLPKCDPLAFAAIEGRDDLIDVVLPKLEQWTFICSEALGLSIVYGRG